ncbi:matrixin family metalloprotease [Candidatus Regiella endosymbiont of Tuberolachnus salignus]|uniref:matrixin family metalloprotease n=1 Tax=Candidatus Regiella endosymbiont of Tuberolachnus salignus TaxID=3077956 RepID=UPI0030D14147
MNISVMEMDNSTFVYVNKTEVYEHVPENVNQAVRLRLCVDKDWPAEDSKNPLYSLGESKNFWRTGQTLRIKFMAAYAGSAYVQEKVRHYANEWLEYANLKFDWLPVGSKKKAHIRIAFKEGDGNWSDLGKNSRKTAANEPTMNFDGFTDDPSDEAYLKSATLHEFGHALGLLHEHHNPEGGIQWNKPVVFAYYLDMFGWDAAKTEYNLFKKYAKNKTQYTAYDPKSIMGYPIPEEHTLNGYSVADPTELSTTDKKFIASVYPGRLTVQKYL